MHALSVVFEGKVDACGCGGRHVMFLSSCASVLWRVLAVVRVVVSREGRDFFFFHSAGTFSVLCVSAVCVLQPILHHAFVLLFSHVVPPLCRGCIGHLCFLHCDSGLDILCHSQCLSNGVQSALRWKSFRHSRRNNGSKGASGLTYSDTGQRQPAGTTVPVLVELDVAGHLGVLR